LDCRGFDIFGQLFSSRFEATTVLVNEMCLNRDMNVLIRGFCQLLTVSRYTSGAIWGAASRVAGISTAGFERLSGAGKAAFERLKSWYGK
jgi:hypothetical protein